MRTPELLIAAVANIDARTARKYLADPAQVSPITVERIERGLAENPEVRVMLARCGTTRVPRKRSA